MIKILFIRHGIRDFWRLSMILLSSGFDLADHLRHRSHRAETAPGTGLEEDVYHKADDGGGEHQAIKAEAKLCDPISNSTCGVSPTPGHTE